MTVAMLIILMLIFSSCAVSQSASDESNGDTDDTVSETDAREEEKRVPVYKIIYPKGDEFAQMLAKKLCYGIKAKTGILMSVASDADTEQSSSLYTYEILIGDTDRGISDPKNKNIGNDGWFVTTSGRQIAVFGASQRGLFDGVEYFLTGYTYSNGTFRIAGDTVYREDSLLDKNIKLRVGTFNIKAGRGENTGKTLDGNLDAIAEFIVGAELDVVGLQEVDYCNDRSGGVDIVKELANKAGYEYYRFCPAINYMNGQYGTAVMSKYPITDFQVTALYTDGDIEGRAVGHAMIDVEGVTVDFFNTHLSYESDNARKQQLRQISEMAHGASAFIITADFNTDSQTELALIEGSYRVNNGEYVTFPGGSSAIDDIVLHCNWRVTEKGVVNVGSYSDHDMLYAEITYTK